MLEIRNLKVYYSSHLALEVPSWEPPAGIYWIHGKNGSGKSTFLNSLAGLIPYRGDILMREFSLRKNPERYLRLVNYSATEPVYPNFLLGRDLIHFFLSAKEGTQEQVEMMIDGFQMRDFINHQPISQYSSGMLKKLSLTLALIGQSQLILLDEPFVTLDLDTTAFLQDQIWVRRQQGATIVVAAHTDRFPLEATIVNVESGKLKF